MSVGIIRQNARGILSNSNNSTSLTSLLINNTNGSNDDEHDEYSSEDEVHFVSKKGKNKSSPGLSASVVQNKKKARVYVFGNGENYADDENDIDTSEHTEMCELRPRGASKKTQNVQKEKDVFLEKEICDGETLQNLSLQYGCPVSEFKRINNLITDQDFYALKYIKVPIKRYGLMSQLVTEIGQKNSNKSPEKGLGADSGACWNDSSTYFCDDDDDNNLSPDSVNHPLLIRSISIGQTFKNQSKEAQDFLKHMDLDLERIRSSTRTFDPDEDVEAHKSRKSIQPMQKFDQKMKVNGWDCGVSWRSLIITIVCVGFILPSVYILYFKFHKQPD